MDQNTRFTQIVFHESKRYQVYPLAGLTWVEAALVAVARLGRLMQRWDGV